MHFLCSTLGLPDAKATVASSSGGCAKFLVDDRKSVWSGLQKPLNVARHGSAIRLDPPQFKPKMSSFKRRTPAKQVAIQPGTKLSPSSSLTVLVSTGLPSLDDVLGGGMPLSCSMLSIAPDPHSSYGELVQKYFIAQGLSSGHTVYVIDPLAKDFVRDIMWTPRSAGIPAESRGSQPASNDRADVEDGDDMQSQEHDQKIKIAWRYEHTKQFQTTIDSSSLSGEDFCHAFDLTSRVPEAVIEGASKSGKLAFLEPSGEKPTTQVLEELSKHLQSSGPCPHRICIPALGSPLWGDLTAREVIHFLHSLRGFLRLHPHACASIALPAHLSEGSWGGPGWLDKLGWVSDAAISLAAFSGNPSLALTFPSHHGFLRILSLPAPHTILPPSDKFSALRGLSSSAVSIGGSGENNLAFKCTRKRLIFETLHLDLEGGVGERRTTPSVSGQLENAQTPPSGPPEAAKALAAVTVEVETPAQPPPSNVKVDTPQTGTTSPKPKKIKKTVGFRSDRPDLYDF